MNLVYNVLEILCYLLFVPYAIYGRKYDLEAEAVKLYGEDFRSVLQRFRRTPDYLKILRDKMNDLNTMRGDMGVYSKYFFYEKLKRHVRQLLEQEKAGDNNNTIKPSNVFRSPFNFRRQEDLEEEKSPVQKLDSYSKLNSIFSVSERNAFRDMGFQYAGSVIHAMITGMGPDDAPAKSTRFPFAGDHDNLATTTEHAHIHQVTSEHEVGSTAAPEVSTTPGAFRYKYRQSHTKSK